MATRYVNGKTGRNAGPFTSATAPARTVAAAIHAADPGDTVEIQGTGSFVEDELVIDKALSLVSSHALANPGVDPTAPGFNLALLPELTAKAGARHRVLRVAGTPATRTTMGPVRVSGLRIRGGHAVHTANEPALGAGGGIAVIDADDVRIEGCVITANRTETAPLAPWPEADRLALRTAVLDLAGTFVSPAGAAALNRAIDFANPFLVRLGKPPLAHFDRAKLLAKLGSDFDAKLGPGRPNSWIAGQAFGGGIAAVWASPTIRNCLLRGNIAEGRGAGLAVVGYGWPSIGHCWFDANRSGSQGRRDGGGVGCEITLPGHMSRNLSELDLVRFLVARINAIKTSLGSPLEYYGAADIAGLAIWLVNPSGPHPLLRGSAGILGYLVAALIEEGDKVAKGEVTKADELKKDAKGIGRGALDLVLYYLATAALNKGRWKAWKQDEVERARRTDVAIDDCRFTENRCDDDGGGLYASVLSRVKVTKSSFTGNLAQGGGGGIRLTMGSAGTIDACEIAGNTAIVADPENKLVAAGGGLSVRNADVTLTATRIGWTGNTIGPSSNVCSDHAGGGICFQADTEGALAGIPDFWTTIMREVFEVGAVKVLIDSSCRVGGNGAGYDAGRHPLGAAKKAKGGGIWLLQGKFPDAPRVDLRIVRVARTVEGNRAQTKNYASKVDGTSIAAANDVCIQDFVKRREWTEVNYGPLLDRSGDLH
ncbi:MAG TPA: hypothetical protein VJQ84_06210, partial [Solirubrobacterales bacterium]|nr:hypothetical protein [Solirubrobacterales bacterium]